MALPDTNVRDTDAELSRQEREARGLLFCAQQQPEVLEIVFVEQQNPECERAAGAATGEIGTAKAKDGATDTKTGAGGGEGAAG